MKKLTLLALAVFVPVLASCGSPGGGTPTSITGTWSGSEQFPAQHNANAQNWPVVYVINDNAGTLTGQVYLCDGGGTGCTPLPLTGTRNNTSVYLNYTDIDGLILKTNASLNGNTISGSTQYVSSGGLTFNGSTTITKQ